MVVQEALGYAAHASVYPEVAHAAAESTSALVSTAGAGNHIARLIALPSHTGDATT